MKYEDLNTLSYLRDYYNEETNTVSIEIIVKNSEKVGLERLLWLAQVDYFCFHKKTAKLNIYTLIFKNSRQIDLLLPALNKITNVDLKGYCNYKLDKATREKLDENERYNGN